VIRHSLAYKKLNVADGDLTMFIREQNTMEKNTKVKINRGSINYYNRIMQTAPLIKLTKMDLQNYEPVRTASHLKLRGLSG